MTPPLADDVLSAIQDIAANELEHRSPIRPEHQLARDLGLDSVAAMILATGLEDRFRVRLNEQDAEALVTVADLIALVRKRAGEAS